MAASKRDKVTQTEVPPVGKANKILITGLANSGKTSLLQTLQDVLVISYDDKPYPFKQPHRNITHLTSEDREPHMFMDSFVDQTHDALESYKDKFGKYPRYLAIDSVSTLETRVESICHELVPNVYGSTQREIDRQIDVLIKYTNDCVANSVSIVLLSHVIWDDSIKKMTELAKGRFGKKGGFLSTVDYSIYIERKGTVFSIHTFGKDTARTLLPDVPDTYDSKNFNLQEYIGLIENHQLDVSDYSI